MKVVVRQTKLEMARQAAGDGAEAIRQTLRQRGQANIVLATGASQLEMLDELIRAEGIDWNRVVGFHLDEYAGMPISHPASFRLYLWKRFVSRLPVPLRAFHYIRGDGDLEGECQRLSMIIRDHPIDVAFIGIGENGHLAFNDPPADFGTEEPYIIVSLDEACRRQQLGEGWFQTLAEVPTRAISMSIRQIMRSKVVVCTVPDQRKAQAVKNALEGPVTPEVPASILQRHEQATVYLDAHSASLLGRQAPGQLPAGQ